MKIDKTKISSHYWRVRVLATNEEQIFSSFLECCQWTDKVKHTFSDKSMKFEIVEVIELSMII